MKSSVLALLLLAAPLLSAQTPTPKPCTSAESRQFDFWLGDWNVVDAKGNPLGASRIESILGGCVLLENWSSARGNSGKSFNVHVAEEGFWRQTWVDDSGGSLILTGTFHDGKMDLAGETVDRKDSTKNVKQRITWEKVQGDRVRQVYTTSKDGGKTWQTAFDGIYVRKGATPKSSAPSKKS